jgi:hypothetical protein
MFMHYHYIYVYIYIHSLIMLLKSSRGIHPFLEFMSVLLLPTNPYHIYYPYTGFVRYRLDTAEYSCFKLLPLIGKLLKNYLT